MVIVKHDPNENGDENCSPESFEDDERPEEQVNADAEPNAFSLGGVLGVNISTMNVTEEQILDEPEEESIAESDSVMSDSGLKKTKYYKDTATNRKLNRVGKPY